MRGFDGKNGLESEKISDGDFFVIGGDCDEIEALEIDYGEYFALDLRKFYYF